MPSSVSHDRRPPTADPAHPSVDRLADVAARLDSEGVAWCVLRPGALPDAAGPPSQDEDLLAARDDLAAVRRTLRGIGFSEVSAPGRGSHRFFLRHDPRSGSWTKLDIVTELAFGPLQALRSAAAADCLTRRRRIGGLPRLAPADAFWALLLHDIFDGARIPAEHHDDLQRDVRSAQLEHPLARLLEPACPPGLDPGDVIDLVGAGAWPQLDAVVPNVAARWAAPDPLAARARLAGRRLRRRLSSLGLPPRRGLTVALLGPDGAGKSSLVARLPGEAAVPVRSIYLGLYGATRRPGRWGTGLLLRLGVAWRGYLAARRHRALGRLVVFDRHPLEARVQRTGPLPARVRRWLLAHAIPLPDLIIILDAPVDVLAARRPEHEGDQLARQREAYRQLAASLPHAVVIDAASPPEVVSRFVMAAIWTRAAEVARW